MGCVQANSICPSQEARESYAKAMQELVTSLRPLGVEQVWSYQGHKVAYYIRIEVNGVRPVCFAPMGYKFIGTGPHAKATSANLKREILTGLALALPEGIVTSLLVCKGPGGHPAYYTTHCICGLAFQQAGTGVHVASNVVYPPLGDNAADGDTLDENSDAPLHSKAKAKYRRCSQRRFSDQAAQAKTDRIVWRDTSVELVV